MPIEESQASIDLVGRIFNIVISYGGIIILAGLSYSFFRLVFVPASSTLKHQATVFGLWFLALLLLIPLWAAGTYILMPPGGNLS